MNEEEARDWLRTSFGGGAFNWLEEYAGLLLAEAGRQSLIARSTFDQIWSRHIADSAQLVSLAPDGAWMDVGSGGGLPGIVVAILRDAPVTMVEPRRKRVDYLNAMCRTLKLGNACVIQSNVQAIRGHADILSARAVSSISDIFQWTRSVVSRETLFLLPRGENAVTDLDVAKRAWQGRFHVEQSITNLLAGIVVAQDVRPR